MIWYFQSKGRELVVGGGQLTSKPARPLPEAQPPTSASGQTHNLRLPPGIHYTVSVDNPFTEPIKTFPRLKWASQGGG